MLNFLGYFLGGFHVFVSIFYHVNLELLVYLDFQGITILLLSVLLLNIHTLFFSLTFSFFLLLNVSFIVSFVNKLSFMFPLALLIVILLSIFWYSWIVYVKHGRKFKISGNGSRFEETPLTLSMTTRCG